MREHTVNTGRAAPEEVADVHPAQLRRACAWRTQHLGQVSLCRAVRVAETVPCLAGQGQPQASELSWRLQSAGRAGLHLLIPSPELLSGHGSWGAWWHVLAAPLQSRASLFSVLKAPMYLQGWGQGRRGLLAPAVLPFLAHVGEACSVPLLARWPSAPPVDLPPISRSSLSLPSHPPRASGLGSGAALTQLLPSLNLRLQSHACLSPL